MLSLHWLITCILLSLPSYTLLPTLLFFYLYSWILHDISIKDGFSSYFVPNDNHVILNSPLISLMQHFFNDSAITFPIFNYSKSYLHLQKYIYIMSKYGIVKYFSYANAIHFFTYYIVTKKIKTTRKKKSQ